MGRSPNIRIRMQVLAFLFEAGAIGDNPGVSFGEIQDVLSQATAEIRTATQVSNRLQVMRREGLISNLERGVWTVTPFGEEFFKEYEAEFQDEPLLPSIDDAEVVDLAQAERTDLTAGVSDTDDVTEPTDTAPATTTDDPEDEDGSAHLSDDEFAAALEQELGSTEEGAEEDADELSEDELELDEEDSIPFTTRVNGSKPAAHTRSKLPDPFGRAAATNGAPASSDVATLPSRPKPRPRPLVVVQRPRVRTLPPDPSPGTLRAEVLAFVRISGGAGNAARITKLCQHRGFTAAGEAEVLAELEALSAAGFIRPRRWQPGGEPFAYAAYSQYGELPGYAKHDC